MGDSAEHGRQAGSARQTTRSAELFERAQHVLPGGVNSPVRAFKAVGGSPVFIKRGSGCYVEDVDGNRYIDYLGSWGPLILGHAAPPVVEAVREAAAEGTSFGMPTEREVLLGEMIAEAFPSMELTRLVSSGTEAAMSAIRVARAFTGRSKVVKFDGCYHGHSDGLLVQAGSGALTFGAPDSPGVPEAIARETVSLPYNDLGPLAAAFDRYGADIAAVIVEPIAGNMGVVPPAPGFLQGLRDVTQRHGALLIFDEVITGFRVAYGGAQRMFGVRPDLTCLGKILGGGLPLGAYGGRRDVMEQISPLGPTYQAGTLSGNPLATAAGLAMLRTLRATDPYASLERRGAALEAGLVDAAERAGVPLTVSRVGSMLTAFFTAGPVTDYVSARRADTARYARFFRGMLDRGVYLAPSQFEAAFVSTAHGDAEIERSGAAARATLEALAGA
ncbi:MAG: glutamate-1-semialdehyde 2,1-aminomutase [Chloroflexi bacterium]|nr:glutamate-1-semialdehyde 2,1-aminomutase [Chloroflexota bacterium]